ncbi:MFS domain-containing protein [Favolaschia claudopus]|uniref:MFS domain-containing protein n=1 Tax=Favolaschia claudopus TaxID=2862362 RepID=A0AAW0BU07_9AGAR
MRPPSLISMLLALFCVLVLPWTVSSSTVTLVAPIDEQLPGIARIGQPYTWSFSSSTFTSTTGDIDYRVSSLPSWLSFDPATRTFHGNPAAKDEGNPSITITAHDSSSSVSSSFTLCVTPYPAPTVHTPLSDQFYTANPSLSSVFILSSGSALKTPNPALRIPPGWSFSIGFQPETFVADNNLYYSVLQANGSVPPDWMEYNPRSLTLNGVVPNDDSLSIPSVFSMNLHGSDQEGYSAQTLPFNIVIAAHELSQSEALPTMNVTQGTPFNLSLSSPDDFAGVRVDGQPVALANITTLLVDTSQCEWLVYDNTSQILSGTPPSDLGTRCWLPTTLGSSFNQLLQTNMTVAVVESYFTSPSCPTQTIQDDRKVNFSLQSYVNSAKDPSDEVTLSAAFSSPDGLDFLSFDSASATLSGTVPDTFSASRIDVTFTAYRRLFHSTSHTTLTLSIPSAAQSNRKGPVNLSAATHKKLVLALGVIFGVIGIVCVLGTSLALFRRCARVEDTAQVDHSAWSDSDRKWYGVVDEEKGYKSSMPRSAIDLSNSYSPEAEPATPLRTAPDYGGLGLGLRRVVERSGSDPLSNVNPNSNQSPGVMRKAEFLTRIRQTVRNVSEKYGSRRQASATRPIIGKPIPVVPDGLPFDSRSSPSNPFDDANQVRSSPGSIIILDSPSTSTGEHSIPRRRADFAPPRAPAAVHFQDRLPRELSSGSLSSNEEAIVHVASKATSIRSGMSHHQSAKSIAPQPRLVPFTSAARVPIPRVPSLSADASLGSSARRVTSQRAVVLKDESDDGMDSSPTADDLSMGIHYVRTLGVEHADVDPDPSTFTVSTHVRSSFSSLESSHHGHAAASIMRTLVRTGESFKFRVPVSVHSAASYQKARRLEAKLMSGKPLPKFLHVDLNGAKRGSAVEFYGAPAARDLGEFSVGIYTVDDGACVGRVVVEVVAASR